MDRGASGNATQHPLALMVDGDPSLAESLERCSFEVVEARGLFGALQRLEINPIRLVLVAGKAPEMNFEPLIERVTTRTPLTLLLLPEPRSSQTGLEWIRRGVFDLFPPGIPAERVERALERGRRQIQTFDDLRRKMGSSGEAEVSVVGTSSGIQRLRAELARLSKGGESVWVFGESGSGRELAARHLHALSSRRDRSFVPVPCAAVAKGSRESFWALDSSGSGGIRNLFEQAQGGTLFLDSVTELSFEAQESLACALDRSRDATFRIVTSSDRTAHQAVETGKLLGDLATHLAEFSVVVPALRNRREDIAALARHIAGRISELNGMPPIDIVSDAIAALERYNWPGNVRELRESIEHAAIYAIDGTLRATDLPALVTGTSAVEKLPNDPPTPLSTLEFRAAKRAVVDAFEETYLRELLGRHSGNVTAASQQSGMLRSALQRLLRKHGLRSAEFRKSRARRVPEPVISGAESTI